MSDWRNYCSIDEGQRPAAREAWRKGWTCRMRRGPDIPSRETIQQMVARPELESVWLQGYGAAHRRETSPSSRR